MYRSGHNGAHSKCVCRVTGTRVRIPPSPPNSNSPLVLGVEQVLGAKHLRN